MNENRLHLAFKIVAKVPDEALFNNVKARLENGCTLALARNIGVTDTMNHFARGIPGITPCEVAWASGSGHWGFLESRNPSTWQLLPPSRHQWCIPVRCWPMLKLVAEK
jgi:hypothetical protein